ncbi:unnamed protein product [Euphydryas editha]|uniref:Uncharacterized protein n=1 Tax=Euphydryas editha TaxID=104508 RepID=A0AAU9UVS8_EUPED|nr:unnamed protein product [Euphydryas editha]
MEDIFNKLKKDHQNTVDNLVKWMKDSKIVDGLKVTEDKARKFFEDANDGKNIEIEKFKEVLSKLASEQKKTVEEFANSLAEEGPKILSSVKAAASAAASTFKENLSKNK